MLASLAAMALALSLGLRQASDLLDELSASQTQLAAVTRVEADINGLVADSILHDRSDAQLGAAAGAVEAELLDYLRSVQVEPAPRGDPAEAAAHQAREARRARSLADTFAQIGGGLLAPDPQTRRAARTRIEADRRQVGTLVRQIAGGERQEAREAIEAMRDLRARMIWLGAAIPVGCGLLGIAVAGFVVSGIAAQRQALSAANLSLESQVAERTREIEASRQRLAETDRSRRLFVSKLSHELRTPATVILGEAEVALRDTAAPPERLREALEHIVANGAFLQRRLQDLLALARAEDGRILLQRRPVDIVEVVRAAADLAAPYLSSSGLSLAADLPDGGLTIDGDPSWLQQALLAIIDNAAKFAPESEAVRLTLRIEGREALIAVADGGPGVPTHNLPFLFESYYQGPAGAERGGAGLGLAIARWVVEQHGGTIAARNEPKRGLVIEMHLPAAKA